MIGYLTAGPAGVSRRPLLERAVCITQTPRRSARRAGLLLCAGGCGPGRWTRRRGSWSGSRRGRFGLDTRDHPADEVRKVLVDFRDFFCDRARVLDITLRRTTATQ
jgi:hypothetical protein